MTCMGFPIIMVSSKVVTTLPMLKMMGNGTGSMMTKLKKSKMRQVLSALLLTTCSMPDETSISRT